MEERLSAEEAVKSVKSLFELFADEIYRYA